MSAKGAENRGKSAEPCLTVRALFYKGMTGQKSVCRANPALTINAITERAAMALFMPLTGKMQLGGAQ